MSPAPRNPGPLSTSSDAAVNQLVEAQRVIESTPALGRRYKLDKKDAHGAFGRTIRAIVRAEWEAGETMRLLSERHEVSERTIERWKAKYKWSRSLEDAPSAILAHARAEIKRKVEMQKIQVETAFTDVMTRHKAATSTLTDMLHEAMGRALAYPHKDPFRQMLVVKIASEIAKNIQIMDRKTYEMDDNKTKTTTTAIFEVLDTMEDRVEAESKKLESRADKEDL